ncbi:MAG: hypothetical protein HC897_12315 [Thermoanaerobaculia bacterium]|nr:hypothetical protein [Thermoanaerobaculia bacterium]
MNSPFDIWRQRFWLWFAPALFFLVNLVVFGFYRYTYSGKVDVVRARVESEAQQLAALEANLEKLSGLRERLDNNHAHVEELREVWFATEATRLTRSIARLKTLVRDAGLSPDSYTYPSQPIEGQDLVRYEFAFQVEGTYEQIRRFVNFLELTEDFFIIEEITLDEGSGSAGDPRLRVRFLLSTVFVSDTGARRAS